MYCFIHINKYKLWPLCMSWLKSTSTPTGFVTTSHHGVNSSMVSRPNSPTSPLRLCGFRQGPSVGLSINLSGLWAPGFWAKLGVNKTKKVRQPNKICEKRIKRDSYVNHCMDPKHVVVVLHIVVVMTGNRVFLRSFSSFLPCSFL